MAKTCKSYQDLIHGQEACSQIMRVIHDVNLGELDFQMGYLVMEICKGHKNAKNIISGFIPWCNGILEVRKS